MEVIFFRLEAIQNKRNLKSKIVQKISQKAGTAFQKITQMMQDEENRTIILDLKQTNFVLELIKREKPELYCQISNFSENFFQGSIANVHKAILNDGTTLAVKTVRKNVLEKVKKDLNYTDKLITASKTMLETSKFHNIENFTESFIKDIEKECDLKNEYKHYIEFKQNFIGLSTVKPPRLYEDYCSGNILIYEWLDETMRIDEISSLSRQFRNSAAKDLSELFFLKPFLTGLIQEDSNLANFIITDRYLNIIDFGKIHFIPLRARIAMAKLIEVTYSNQKFNYLDIYMRIGFDRYLLEPIEHILPNISEILLEPLLCDKFFDFNNWHPVSKINTLCGELKWNFRAAAPMTYFSLVRSFFGFIKIMRKLDAGLQLFKIREDILLEHADYLKNYKTSVETKERSSVWRGKYLNIIVKRNKKEKVNLKLPAHIIYDIDNYLSDTVRKELKKRNENIHDLIQTAIKNDSNEIISIDDGDDSFTVRLSQ